MIRGKDCLSRLWMRDGDVIATLVSSIVSNSMTTAMCVCMNVYCQTAEKTNLYPWRSSGQCATYVSNLNSIDRGKAKISNVPHVQQWGILCNAAKFLFVATFCNLS
jgi:hypothetical protein